MTTGYRTLRKTSRLEDLKPGDLCHQNPTVEQHGAHTTDWTIRCDHCGQWVISNNGIDQAIYAWNSNQRR